MFGIRHCIAYECGMNGSNHEGERDRQPLEFCPECQAKLWWTTKIDPVKRAPRISRPWPTNTDWRRNGELRSRGSRARRLTSRFAFHNVDGERG